MVRMAWAVTIPGVSLFTSVPNRDREFMRQNKNLHVSAHEDPVTLLAQYGMSLANRKRQYLHMPKRRRGDNDKRKICTGLKAKKRRSYASASRGSRDHGGWLLLLLVVDGSSGEE